MFREAIWAIATLNKKCNFSPSALFFYWFPVQPVSRLYSVWVSDSSAVFWLFRFGAQSGLRTTLRGQKLQQSCYYYSVSFAAPSDKRSPPTQTRQPVHSPHQRGANGSEPAMQLSAGQCAVPASPKNYNRPFARRDLVTWYGINYAAHWTQITQWENKRKSSWTGKNSFALEGPTSTPCRYDSAVPPLLRSARGQW